MTKLYRDIIHGFQAKAQNKSIAWFMIRNKCKELNIIIPSIDKIEEIKSLEG